MQTLDNLLQQKQITLLQYLERIPDGYIPARRALIAELKAQQAQMQMLPPEQSAPAPGAEGGALSEQLQGKPEIPTGGGFSDLQRKVIQQGSTEGMI